MEIAAVNNRIFCSMLRIERFQSHDSTASKLKREAMRGASKRCFDAQFVEEDEVFDFICKLGVIIEVQERFLCCKRQRSVNILNSFMCFSTLLSRGFRPISNVFFK